MAATRFPNAELSDTAAINDLADRVNAATQMADVPLSGATTVLTAAQMVNAIVRQSGANGALSVATATAAAMVALIPDVQVGSFFEFMIMNTNNATVTLTAGTGVTLVGVTAVPTNTTQLYRGIVTAVGTPAVELIGLMHVPS